MISAEALNDLLLDLYRASREFTVREFQFHALESIRVHIPFEAVWWAMATQMEGGHHHVHDSYLQGMPDDCAELLNLTEQDNLVAQTCSHSPAICFNFAPEQLFSNLQTAMLTQHMGIMHVLCTAWQGSIPQLITFLSLSRRDRGLPFSEDERLLKQCLMPHLADMLQINRVMHIASVRAGDSDSRSAMAVTDEVGMLHAAEPGFELHLCIEWPDWEGPFLPKPLQAVLLANQDRFLGRHLLVRFERVRESTLVTIARRAPSDALSTRERAVAEGFSGGESYKEVARRLGMSPLTVRHHLRIVYEKLGVSDKGELAKLLSQGARSPKSPNGFP